LDPEVFPVVLLVRSAKALLEPESNSAFAEILTPHLRYDVGPARESPDENLISQYRFLTPMEDEGTRHLGKLILWEIVLLFMLVVLVTYMPRFVEMQTLDLKEIVSEILPPALTIVFVLIVTRLFLYVLRPVFNRALPRYLSSSYDVRHTWQFVRYVAWIGAFVLLSFLLLGNITTLSIFLGLVAAVFIIMSHEAIANFAGWLHIIFRTPVVRGEIVEVGGVRGRISEVTTMNIVLEEIGDVGGEFNLTGRKVTIPNRYLFSKPVSSIRSERSLIWDEIDIMLASRADNELAEEIISQVAKSAVGPVMRKHRQEMIQKHPDEADVPSIPETSVSLEPEGVLITLRYFCPASERLEIRSMISRGILREFREEGIEIVFRAENS